MTVHNIDQVMAWQPEDVAALAGRLIGVVEPDDDRAFWADRFRYTGDWCILGQGVVKSASMDAMREHVRVEFEDGSFLNWIFGQPVNVIEVPRP